MSKERIEKIESTISILAVPIPVNPLTIEDEKKYYQMSKEK